MAQMAEPRGPHQLTPDFTICKHCGAPRPAQGFTGLCDSNVPQPAAPHQPPFHLFPPSASPLASGQSQTVVTVADPQATASADALWAAIQRVEDDPAVYSDPSRLIELPFPFPGTSMPTERFDLHEQSQHSPRTFLYMGRQRFSSLLQEVPVPETYIQARWRAKYSAGPTTLNAHSEAVSSTCSASVPSVAQFFPPIRDDIVKRSPTTFIYGTIGWGKSHLLAAMVCLLMRKGRKIVYLPDCKMLVRDPVKYFRSALLLTYAADAALQSRVATLTSIEQLLQFCGQQPDLTYIVDQYNALEQDMKRDDADTLAAKSSARRMVDSATFDRASLLAASANNFTARIIHDKQLNMNIVTLFGGLAQEEMTAWYRHFHCLEITATTTGSAASVAHDSAPAAAASAGLTHPASAPTSSVSPASEVMPSDLFDMRRRLEDMTGCIPLYLRCFVGCTASTFAAVWQANFAQDKRVQRVFNHLLMFYEGVKQEQSEEQWRRHIGVLRCFLLGGNPHTDQYDHRYLFQDEQNFGRIACGLARHCLIAVLRTLGGDRHFVDGPFLSNIKITRNPSMRGFLIEEACLTYIRHDGLLLPSPYGLVKPDQVSYFDAGEEAATVAATTGAATVLFLPRPYNYKSIDALLRRVTFGRNEQGQKVMLGVLLIPIQVTISASHKPSPASFYPKHHVWLEDIDAAVPRQHIFVWLRRDAQESVSHQERVLKTREQGIVTPAYQEVTVTFNTLSGDLHVNTSPPRASAPPSAHAVAASVPIPFNLTDAMEVDASAEFGAAAHARPVQPTPLSPKGVFMGSASSAPLSLSSSSAASTAPSGSKVGKSSSSCSSKNALAGPGKKRKAEHSKETRSG